MAGKFSAGRRNSGQSRPQGASREATPVSAPQPEGQMLNHEQANIQSYLKKVRFQKAFFGVSESDVWKKIGELNALYEAALSAERARYDALLARQKSGGDGYSD